MKLYVCVATPSEMTRKSPGYTRGMGYEVCGNLIYKTSEAERNMFLFGRWLVIPEWLKELHVR